MEPDSYPTQAVIVALQNVGVSAEVIEYVVPIAGYESRVDGVWFTRNALDEFSPSWGIFQANLDSMAPGIYKAMKELGEIVPNVSKEQDKVLSENNAQPGQESLLNFTDEQKQFVATWFKERANLNDNALVFKYIFEQKTKDVKAKNFKEAIDELYPLTVSKFNDPENIDAQEVKQKIINEMNQEPDRGIPEPEDGFEPGPIPSTTTTMPKQDEEIDTTTRSEGITNRFGTPPQDMSRMFASGVHDLALNMMEQQVNRQRSERGLEPIRAKQNKKSIKDRSFFEEALKILGGR